jgi:hypothetical protein
MPGPVVLDPNVTRVRINIDADGNEVAPFSKKIIRRNEPEYTPTPEEVKAAQAKPPSDAKPKDALVPPEEGGVSAPVDGSPIQRAVAAKVQEAVAAEIAKIDIGAMVAKAVQDAFK